MTTSAESKTTVAAQENRFRRERLPSFTAYYEREGVKLIGQGVWRTARCPFHDDRTPSLRINVVKGGFYCHGCGAKGGDVLDFHMRRHSLSFPQAARDLGAWEEPVSFAAPETAKEGARRLSERALDEGYTPTALYTYCDTNGREIYHRFRLDHPAKGKLIRPMHLDGRRYVMREPEFPGGKPLYGLDLLSMHSAKTVMVCEGEKCADALRKRGVLAVTSGSASSALAANWKPLAGRHVVIWPDNDEPGRNYGEAVKNALTELGCKVETIDVRLLGLGSGEDAWEWLTAHTDATEHEVLGLPKTGSQSHAPREASHQAIGRQNETRVRAYTESQADDLCLWAAQRCIRSDRASGGLASMYRDYVQWCREAPMSIECFKKVLESRLDVWTDEELAHGFALMCDVDEYDLCPVNMLLSFDGGCRIGNQSE